MGWIDKPLRLTFITISDADSDHPEVTAADPTRTLSPRFLLPNSRRSGFLHKSAAPVDFQGHILKCR